MRDGGSVSDLSAGATLLSRALGGLPPRPEDKDEDCTMRLFGGTGGLYTAACLRCGLASAVVLDERRAMDTRAGRRSSEPIE